MGENPESQWGFRGRINDLELPETQRGFRGRINNLELSETQRGFRGRIKDLELPETHRGFAGFRSSEDPQDMERTSGHGSARPRDEPKDMERNPKISGRSGGFFGGRKTSGVGKPRLTEKPIRKPYLICPSCSS